MCKSKVEADYSVLLDYGCPFYDPPENVKLMSKWIGTADKQASIKAISQIVATIPQLQHIDRFRQIIISWLREIPELTISTRTNLQALPLLQNIANTKCFSVYGKQIKFKFLPKSSNFGNPWKKLTMWNFR